MEKKFNLSFVGAATKAVCIEAKSGESYKSVFEKIRKYFDGNPEGLEAAEEMIKQTCANAPSEKHLDMPFTLKDCHLVFDLY